MLLKNILKIKNIIYILTIVLLSILFMFLLPKEEKASYSAEFKNYQGYEDLIKTIQKEHPNWEFEILKTGLEWSEVIIQESTGRHQRNVVPKSSGSAWKCACNASHENNWVCASTAAVAYYMDPRNSINEDYIFQFEQLTYDANIQTAEGVKAILADCNYMQGNIKYYDAQGKLITMNKTYIDVIMEAAKTYNVSPYHLASRIRQEQGAGNAGAMISGKYKGYEGLYNYFNIKAYGSDIIVNGLTWAKKQGWTNPELAIKGGAALIVSDYISCGQDTLYLQKFDVVDGGDGYYTWQYMTNVSASKTEGYEIREAYRDMGMLTATSKIKFKIPVYENMPEMKASRPGTEQIVTQDVQINANDVVVRNGKGTNYTKIATLNKGTKLLRIELDNSKDASGIYWDKVVLSDGKKGYVSRKYLTELSIQSNSNESYIVSAYTNFRNGPGVTSTTIIKLLSPGQLLTVVEKGKYKNVDNEEWYRVKISDGTYGYVGTGYIEPYNPETSQVERVKVLCSIGINIRKEPTTRSTVLKAVAKGTVLTRTEKNVKSTDTKYTWDKVTTSSGVVGYVVREDPDTKEAWIKPLTTTEETTTIKGTGFKSISSNVIAQPNITVENIKESVPNAVIKKGNTIIKNTENIGTGYTVTTNGKTYTIVVKGDVNGDGKVSSADYIRIKNYMLKKITLTNAQGQAIDANGDGKNSSADYIRIKNYMLKKATISI